MKKSRLFLALWCLSACSLDVNAQVDAVEVSQVVPTLESSLNQVANDKEATLELRSGLEAGKIIPASHPVELELKKIYMKMYANYAKTKRDWLQMIDDINIARLTMQDREIIIPLNKVACPTQSKCLENGLNLTVEETAQINNDQNMIFRDVVRRTKMKNISARDNVLMFLAYISVSDYFWKIDGDNIVIYWEN